MTLSKSMQALCKARSEYFDDRHESESRTVFSNNGRAVAHTHYGLRVEPCADAQAPQLPAKLEKALAEIESLSWDVVGTISGADLALDVADAAVEEDAGRPCPSLSLAPGAVLIASFLRTLFDLRELHDVAIVEVALVDHPKHPISPPPRMARFRGVGWTVYYAGAIGCDCDPKCEQRTVNLMAAEK